MFVHVQVFNVIFVQLPIWIFFMDRCEKCITLISIEHVFIFNLFFKFDLQSMKSGVPIVQPQKNLLSGSPNPPLCCSFQ